MQSIKFGGVFWWKVAQIQALKLKSMRLNIQDVVFIEHV